MLESILRFFKGKDASASESKTPEIEEEYLCPKCNEPMEWYVDRASAHDAGSMGYWCKECEVSIELYIQ